MAKKDKKKKKGDIDKLNLPSSIGEPNDNNETNDDMSNEEFDKLLQDFIDSELRDLNNNDSKDDSNKPLKITEPFSIKESAQFIKIESTLLKEGWELDLRAIDKNILLFSRDNENFILYLFYGSGKDRANEWQADEEKFNGLEPLWFSEDSHLISPKYAVNEYVKTLDIEKVSYSQPIVVIMKPNYIINAKDMIKIWDDKLIISDDRLCELIEIGEDLDCVDTEVADIGTPPNKGMLIESICDIGLTNLEPNDGIDTDAEDFKEIEINNIRYNINPFSNNKVASPLKSTCFRSSPDALLFVWFDIEGEVLPKAQYTCELRDANNKLVARDTTAINDIPGVSLYIMLNEALVGKYWFYIKHNGKELYSEELTFVDYDKDYDKYIKLEAFGLYRIDAEYTNDDYLLLMERGMKSCYDYKGLEGVLITPQFKNISGKELSCQLSLIVKNEQGKVVYKDDESCELDNNEEHIFINEVRGMVCAMGNYSVTIKFFDETILETDFIVGDRDVNATLKVDQLVARSGMKSNSKLNVKEPMQELDSMIGLTELKKQLRQQVAKIQFDNVRKEHGLPTKAQQLHMAFLGNPGTGKTTVAKLLGQIYKEIGVLSKGHVVLEDRSTLMTQSWGGEGEMVNKALAQAKGGILFIDEAYDLITENKSDPGKLIISALLQAMADENNRDFMIIFAGYTMPMERLLSKNPGLRSRLTSMYFEDFNAKELMQIADRWLGKNCYTLSDDARKYVESIIASAYASRNENFGNARFVTNLLENEIQPAMAERVMAQGNLQDSISLLTTIEACDIPNYNSERGGATEAIARLDKMVGLGELKSQIRSHLSYIRFVQARRENKIETPIPPLHMVFTGNPGTGKTSVAEYIGDIYRSMGLLSVGNVIKVSRADMVDNIVGGTEVKMKELLNAAHGNILFIDEAYSLFCDINDGKDFAKIAVEALLDALGKENPDMIVIIAGYPKEMDDLLSMNAGLKGRFPYTFNFEDYDEDELFEIAEGVIERNSLTLTQGASDALKAVIRKECKIKDANFSNARFVVRLITTQVLPNMAMRLEGETDPEKLKRVLQRDIPIEHKEIRMINENLFDEDMIEAALERLDAMVGLTKVKVAIHQFVDFARSLNRKDPIQIERYPLKWSFVGNTGTGKSSVAEILSEILKGMHLLGKGHTVEVKAEELYGVAIHKADELLQKRMRESLQGLLFVDGDAPQFRASNSTFNPEYLRVCLASNTNEIHGRFAVVIAEQDSPTIGLAKSLDRIGISNFNHTLIFDDYTADELMAILSSQLSKHDLALDTDAATIMYSYISRLSTNDANARTMKELARTIRNMTSAINSNNQAITAEIVEKFATTETPRKKIGY